MTKHTAWLLLLALVSLASGQDSEKSYSGHGYGHFAAGTCVRWGCGTLLSLGGGAEGFVYRGLAVGAELGYTWPSRHMHDGIYMLSANPAYHFKGAGRSRRVVPFVTGGYTGFFREGWANGFNYGGGVTWWAADHVGLRFEVRNHHAIPAVLDESLLMFRFGVSFR